MEKDFTRVAIVNRGEPAMRFIHAVQEYNRENNTALRAMALYTEPDRRAMFVREADEAVNLGAATYIDPRDGQRKNSYLDYERLERALIESRAEAVWVGWGFVAEHAEFVELCNRLGIVFIGPSAEVMRQLGDKITSKLLAEQADIPVVPWSGAPVTTLEEARFKAESLGYPLMIKATAGGGGRGIRKVQNSGELANAFASAQSEALKAFGDATVFLEKQIPKARHVEVQIMGDHYGIVWAVGVRDCTIQRRNQKILEEAPSPTLTIKQDRALREAARRIGQTLGYQNAGTVEFLFDHDSGNFWFMEVNARLQVEHPVTELTTGLDLVKLQIHIARGGKLEGRPPVANGHAIEVRLNAEDPANLFAPAPGKVALFRLPTGPGVRIDTGVAEGDEVPSEFDSMIAKIITHGRDRHEALARLKRALAQTSVIIKGGMSNKGFLLELLERPEVASSALDVGWLDRLVQKNEHLTRRHAEVALLHAAVEAYLAEMEIEKTQFFTSAHRGRPEVKRDLGLNVKLVYQGEPYAFEVYRLGTQQYRIDVEGQRIPIHTESLGQSEWRLTIGGATFQIFAMSQDHTDLIEVNSVPHRISRDPVGVIKAPAPAVVISTIVKEGDQVNAGDRLIVLEAMKMEMSVVAGFSGTVRQILVRNNMQVAAGAALLLIEPADQEKVVAGAGRVNFAHLVSTSEATMDLHCRCEQNLAAIKCLLLGFDVDQRELKRLMEERGKLCAEMPANETTAWLWKLEDEVLAIFIDLISLFRREPVHDELSDNGRLSSEEYFFTYLLNTRAGEEGLPAGFMKRLRGALSHYGLPDIEPGALLDMSLFRICKSHQRMAKQIAPILSILERRLEQSAPEANGAFRELLDRLITETQNRFIAVNELAREVRYRYFDQPLLDQVRQRVYVQAESHLDYLSQNPRAGDRQARVQELVQCPQPLHPLLAKRFENAGPEMRQIILEVLSRRYYLIRQLENVEQQWIDNHGVLTAEYDWQDQRIHLITSHADYEDLPAVAASLHPLLKKIPVDHDVVIDFYVWQRRNFANQDETVEKLRALLAQAEFPRPLRRVVVAMAKPQSSLGMSGLETFTFRPSPAGFQEEKVYRGLHPMIGKRLEIWRLGNFNIERVPAVEDVYLFKAVARENPDDRRLFAFAEVRDLTQVVHRSERVVALPNLELMLQESLAGIRRIQATQAADKRFYWNRVLLYTWPPLMLKPDELHSIIRRLAPAAEGLGLEKVVVRGRLPQGNGELKEKILDISNPAGGGLRIRFREPCEQPIRPLSHYAKKVVKLQRRGLVYPYELLKMITPKNDGTQAEFPTGEFVEYDFDQNKQLAPVQRLYGQNKANIVVGVIRNFTNKYPEGMDRVILVGDPSIGMGSLAEPECRRIIAGLDLAEKMRAPVEWFALSAGAKISMDSGTENMDWIARVLRRLVEFTQAGGEVNIIVTGINVGAQPYWNAEATMLMHTRGILVMMPESAMVLTGKQALEYSGGVAAEDNQGIGGYERIMGPNGQAQYFAKDLGEACRILFRYYDHTYRAPGERFPRQAATTDPKDRDARTHPHSEEFAVVGEIFGDEKNAGRKKPFDIRKVMMAAIDQDHPPLERWFGMQDAEIAVVWDAHLGGYPVCLLGFESRPLPRLGIAPADGPDHWTAGTLFPLSSKKIARAINAASNNRPLVVLANLSGFDGSPESMRKWQLEYGAEIGRAVVNFRGPIVFCVVSRYHGGAFVVFSNALHDNMEIAALEGTYASVIGGAPAAAVVFAREVENRTQQDTRILTLEGEIALARGAEKVRRRSQWNELYQAVYSEKLGEVADEFDSIHSVQRAQRVGSVNCIIPPAQLRPYLIEAVERGMQREIKRLD